MIQVFVDSIQTLGILILSISVIMLAIALRRTIVLVRLISNSIQPKPSPPGWVKAREIE